MTRSVARAKGSKYRGLVSFIAVAVALTLLGVVVTGSSSAKTVGTPTTVTLSSKVPPQLVGNWRRNITAADWTKAGAPGYASYAGLFSIAVKRSGDVGVYLPGTSYADFTAGFSVLAGGRLTIDRVPDCGGTKGLYRWKVAGRLLTITKLRDSCAGEVGLFAGVWKRK